MKLKRLLIVTGTLAALALTAGVPGQLRTSITLMWDYPTNLYDTNLVFVVRSSVDPLVPLANWPVLATTPGTNRQMTVEMAPGLRFYVVTTSNLWGESGFSNVALTPPPPGQGFLTIK